MTKRGLGLALVVLPLLVAMTCFTAGFQNAGNTGTQTVSQIVTYTGTFPTFHSQIFNNIGQSAHWLSYCTVGGSFAGTIDLEESFDGLTNWQPIAYGNYQAVALASGACAVLQAGGYFQNVRSTITNATIGPGFPSATYNASSGPIALYAVSLATSGAASPTLCTQTEVTTVGAGSTQQISVGYANNTTRVCGYHFSFSAAPTTGFLEFQSSTSPSSCAGLGTIWFDTIYSGTPPLFGYGGAVGALFSGTAGNAVCFTNTTTTSVVIDVNYASIYGAF